MCKVDVEGCGDLSEGECIVICKESSDAEEGRGNEGINKIMAMDDLYVWTATGSSTVKRWTNPPRRITRLKDMDTDGENHLPEAPSAGRLPFGLSPANVSPVVMRSPMPSLNKRDSSGISIQDASPPPLRPDSPSNSGTKHTQARTHRPRLSTYSTPTVTGLSYTSSALNINSGISDGTLLGMPYSSLVRLASPHDPYSPAGSSLAFRTTRDAEISTLYSAASIRSVPMNNSRQQQTPVQYPSPLISALRGQVDGGFAPSSPPSINNPRFAIPADAPRDPAIEQAKEAYDDREFAIDATPLHAHPLDTLQGSHGLVRSVILNDRLHALTVDTAGEVAVWDLIRGLCLGVFASEDVGNASTAGSSTSEYNGVERSPREALETVRERIEGEAMCPTWSTVDTKIGHLTVHMHEARCFDAETYVDDAMFLDAAEYPEEHKGEQAE